MQDVQLKLMIAAKQYHGKSSSKVITCNVAA